MAGYNLFVIDISFNSPDLIYFIR